MSSLCENEAMSSMCDSCGCSLGCCNILRSSDPIFYFFWRFWRQQSLQAEAIAMSGTAHDMKGNVCDPPIAGVFKIRACYPIIERSHGRTAPDLKIFLSIPAPSIYPIASHPPIPTQNHAHLH